MENINLHKFLSKKFVSTISPFYYNFLTYSQDLCKSKKVQINRRIIEKLFNDKIKVFECKQYYTISFMTNGLIINNKIIKYLKSRVIKEIYISLDGYKKIQDFQRTDLAGQGTYNRIAKNIKLLKRNGFTICISCVITPQNINLTDIFNHFIKLGIKKNRLSFCSSKQKL